MADVRTSYRFESEWALEAPIEQVFGLLVHPDGAEGPKSLQSKLLNPGDSEGVGRRAWYRIRSPLVYSMEFVAEVVEVERPTLLHSIVEGDLEGTGTYHLEPRDGTTTIRFHWQVATTKRWMNLLAPLAQPVFVWAHDRVMDQLIWSMAHNLDARLVSSSTRLVSDDPAHPAD